MVCGYFREDIPCELLGIFTLVHVNKTFSNEGSFNLCGSGVTKYLNTATVKASRKCYNTTQTYDMIFTKAGASTSDEQVETLTRESIIHYRDCIGSLIYLLSTRVDLSFTVHKLAKFSSNPGKVHFEGLLHILRYIRDNKTLGLKYYADLTDKLVLKLRIT